jgi:hypothetical protein
MPRKPTLAGLTANPRRRHSFLACLEVAGCARALGDRCEPETGLDYEQLEQVLARLAAAIEAGKCDGAYAGEV